MSALGNYIITNNGAEFTINKRLATWTTIRRARRMAIQIQYR